MTKQQIDRNHSLASGACLERFTQIEKEQNPSEASKLLQRRTNTPPGDARMAAFLKIDRRKAG